MGDNVDSKCDQEHLNTYHIVYKRWKRKTLQARWLTGVLMVICCILVVILIVSYKSRHTKSQNAALKGKENDRSSSAMKFIHLSDIHYDPFYNKTASDKSFCRWQEGNTSTATYFAPYGRIGCDSPLVLLEISLDAIKNITDDDEIYFILLTGDLSGHRMWKNYAGPERVMDNIATVSNKIQCRFPDIPIFPVIGNNDLPGHYVLPNSGSDWYQKLLSYWGPLILCSGCPGYTKNWMGKHVLQETFLEGGYYNTSIAGGKIVLLVLNSLYWSVSVERSVETDQKALRQLVWLEKQLMIARSHGQKAILASHIPPGVDTYYGKPYWFGNYTDAYFRIVTKNYNDLVIGQFFAHTHKDDYRLQTPSNVSVGQQDPAESFVLLAPSISPVYHNNPAFRMLSLDTENVTLMDFTQYFMDLVMATEFSNPVWQLDYTFSKKYPSNNPWINAERINELNQQLLNQTSNTFWKSYVFSRETNYQPMPYNRFTLYCAMRFVHVRNFQKCIKKYNVPGG